MAKTGENGIIAKSKFYSYLLNNQQGDLSEIKVSKIAYLYVVNARGLDDGFNNQLIFEPKLVPVQISDDGIEDNLQKMFDLMNSKNIPEPNPKCKNCAYSRRRSDLDLELNEDNIENFLIRFAEDKIFLESASKLLNEKKLLKTDNKNE